VGCRARFELQFPGCCSGEAVSAGRAVTPRALPPVRGAVSLRRGSVAQGRKALSNLFGDYHFHLYGSGSAALALALCDARRRHGSGTAEAILPAYGCPQLVAACLHAGVRPRLVDTAPGQWGYSLELLRAALSPDTVAVVAVNFLGIGDQASDILSLVRENGSFLIQDSAQYLPTAPSGDWCGDYIVLSFGRGKPLNLLRGGALAVSSRSSLLCEAPPIRDLPERCKEVFLGSRAAGAIFNVVTHPHVYAVASRLPGLGLGETCFEPLRRMTRLPDSVWRQVGPAYELYARKPPRSPWAAVAPEWERYGIRVLTCPTRSPWTGNEVLRLALLAEERQRRDDIVDVLNGRGLGASIMYGTALDRVAAIPDAVKLQGPFANATALADRLFTLPTHRFVTDETVAQTSNCLRGLAPSADNK
jgi:dTDP-4-amino-4,6-dideoxygalactose transaminase